MGVRGLAIWVLWLGTATFACGDDSSPGDAGDGDATLEDGAVEDTAAEDASADDVAWTCPYNAYDYYPCAHPGQVCEYADVGCGPKRCVCGDAELWRCDGGDCDGGSDADAPDVPPPACDPVAGSAFSLAFRPATPWVGGSTRVSATGPDPLANVGLEAAGPGASPAPTWIGVDGTGPYTWSWSVVFPAAGEWCLTFRADPDGTVYQRALVTVTPDAPPVAPFKVVGNHQWTCDEEYTFAINVDTVVLDETGAPLPGVRVLVEHAPCETAADHPPPTEVTTGDDGTVRWENYNPRCFFHERVADAPSDTAIEIYTGIWEEQDAAGGGTCNYCSTYAENVWGHWSYTITFQRVPGAVELCEVPTDHAGQAACSPLLHWEEPAAACTPL